MNNLDIDNIDTSDVSDEMMKEFYAAEKKASDDFWAAEYEMRKLDRLRNIIGDNEDFKDIYKSAQLRFFAAKAVATQYGVFL